LLTHYGYNPATGGTTGYPDAQQEQDALELGDRVVIELEAERDRQAGWPPDPRYPPDHLAGRDPAPVRIVRAPQGGDDG